MPNSNSTMIKKLQMAINNNYGRRILYSTSQFWSIEQNRSVTQYHIKEAIYDKDTGKTTNVKLFDSYSQIQIVLYLRDMLYLLEGKQIPEDNEKWNEIKAKS